MQQMESSTKHLSITEDNKGSELYLASLIKTLGSRNTSSDVNCLTHSEKRIRSELCAAVDRQD